MPGKNPMLESERPIPLIEVLSVVKSEEILARNRVGRLAFSFQGRVNIVPVHFIYEKGWVYGRTAPGGKLLQILRNRRVAFEVDEHAALFDWSSVVVHGTFYILEHNEENAAVFDRAVELLRELLPATLTGSDPVPFRSHLFRINAAEITGRAASPSGGRIIERSDEEPTESAVAEGDVSLRNAVLDSLRNLGGADVSKVIVEVMEGIVVLGGVVETQQDAEEIERAVIRTPTIRVLVPQIEVGSPTEFHPDPVDLARAVIHELSAAIPFGGRDDVRVIVENGWLRAEGTVPSASLHADLVRELRHVRGARGFIDRIRVAGAV
jgi:nitroimidazol reductase NimA-like FMN-containing flavoprotein (pyridoxamine 5'-phosphate oxidase superfamily)/osmotically-inducible protein OsmY